MDKFVDVAGDDVLHGYPSIGILPGTGVFFRCCRGVGGSFVVVGAIGVWLMEWMSVQVGHRDGSGRHDTGDKVIDGLVDVLFALFFEEAAGHANSDGEQRNHSQQGGVGKRGGTDEAAILDEAPANVTPEMNEILEPTGKAHFFFVAGGDLKEAQERWVGHSAKGNTGRSRNPEGRSPLLGARALLWGHCRAIYPDVKMLV